MMKKKRIKRAVTLIEIMIVILLIGLIGGALAYNMRGSLEEGKKFKTKEIISRVEDILLLRYAEGDLTPRELTTNWRDIVKASPLVKGEQFIKDAWGKELIVKMDKEENLKVVSLTLTQKNG
jgi:prepilin-type N-terminal cleavage/methylation domain-containing protein